MIGETIEREHKSKSTGARKIEYQPRKTTATLKTKMTTTTTTTTTMMMLRRQSFFVTLLSFLTLSTNLVGAQPVDYCFLCEYGDYPSNAAHFIDANGKTCEMLDAEMFNPNLTPVGSGQCSSLQNQYRDCCCNPNANCANPAQNPRAAPSTPQINMPMGNEPTCHLCFNKSRPTKPYTITTVIYMPGNPTCEELYGMGLTGNIPASLCYPLQLYMEYPCGCN